MLFMIDNARADLLVTPVIPPVQTLLKISLAP